MTFTGDIGAPTIRPADSPAGGGAFLPIFSLDSPLASKFERGLDGTALRVGEPKGEVGVAMMPCRSKIGRNQLQGFGLAQINQSFSRAPRNMPILQTSGRIVNVFGVRLGGQRRGPLGGERQTFAWRVNECGRASVRRSVLG